MVDTKTAALFCLALTLFLPVGLSKLPTELEDMACEERPGGTYCPQQAVIDNATATFTKDIVCYAQYGDESCTTNCAEGLDSCFGWIKMQNDAKYDSCEQLITNETVEWGVNCNTRTAEKDSEFLALINPTLLDYSKCTKGYEPVEADTSMGIYENTTVFAVHCPFKGKTVTFNATSFFINKTSDTFVILEMAELKQSDVSGFLSQNVIYLLLAAIIVVVALKLFVLKKKA